jgi:2-dehydropantoate 2-reductase
VRFVVLGAGAIGGVIGGRLFEHGHDVVLVARGAHFDALSSGGLRVESPDAVATLPVPVAPDPAAVDFDDGDVVLLATKSQDTLPAVSALAAVAAPSTPVICAQNGVENERVVQRWFADVYGICLMCPATHLVPGTVQAHSAPVTGLLDIGRWPTGVDDRAVAVAAALRRSTFESEPRPDIARWKWGKLLLNLGNAVEALCGGAARTGPLAALVRDEAVACLDAAGIPYVGRREDAERRDGLLTVRPIAGVDRPGSSSWQSLARSSGAIETDYLNGEIVRLGRSLAVPVPANELLQRLAAQAARERRPPGALSEAEVLNLLDEHLPGASTGT